MAKYILAIYEPCQAYLERFLNYINSKKNLLFEVCGFTDLNILHDFLQKNKIELVLFSQNSLSIVSDFNLIVTPSLKKICLQTEILFLGEQHFAAMVNKALNRTPEDFFSYISPYQSMENIIVQLERFLRMKRNVDDSFERHRNFDVEDSFSVYGIYSPVDKVSHPELALKIANSLKRNGNKEKRILYINLEPFSGVESILDYPKDTCLSDIIFFYRTNPGKLSEELLKAKGTFGGMDVLSAPVNPEDLHEIGKESWPDFFSKLSAAGDYQYILLDLNFFLYFLSDKLSIFKKLYIPAFQMNSFENDEFRLLDEDYLMSANELDGFIDEKYGFQEKIRKKKMEEFKEFFIQSGNEEFLEKIMEVKAC